MAKTIGAFAERYVNESLTPVFLYPPLDLDFEVDVVVVVDVDGFLEAPLRGHNQNSPALRV
ncbi:MAG: hypothetical protein QUT30_20870 [Acidobacteriota bacterium]|nr:hypothetical protein [Acidobacteriota bacterium]